MPTWGSGISDISAEERNSITRPLVLNLSAKTRGRQLIVADPATGSRLVCVVGFLGWSVLFLIARPARVKHVRKIRYIRNRCVSPRIQIGFPESKVGEQISVASGECAQFAQSVEMRSPIDRLGQRVIC